MNADHQYDPKPSTVRPRWVLRIIVYALLVCSALGTLALGGDLWTAARQGSIPYWIPLVGPVAFTLFVVVYMVDRWFLVRKKRSPLSRAFFQVGLALVFLTLLWPEQAAQFHALKSSTHTKPLGALLRHSDPTVRLFACELLGRRYSDGDDVAQHDITTIITLSTIDDHPAVRARCTKTVHLMQATSVVPKTQR